MDLQKKNFHRKFEDMTNRIATFFTNIAENISDDDLIYIVAHLENILTYLLIKPNYTESSDTNTSNKEIKQAIDTACFYKIYNYSKLIVKMTRNFENNLKLVFDYASAFYERAYYRYAYKFFTLADEEVIKQYNEDLKNKKTKKYGESISNSITEFYVRYAKFLQEIGDTEGAISCLKMQAESTLYEDKHNSTLYESIVRLRLNHLVKDETDVDDDGEYLRILEEYKYLAELAIQKKQNNCKAWFAKGLVYERMSIHTTENIHTFNPLVEAAIQCYERAVKYCRIKPTFTPNKDTTEEQYKIALRFGNYNIILGKAYASLIKEENDLYHMKAKEKLDAAKAIFSNCNFPVYKNLADEQIRQVESKFVSEETESYIKKVNILMSSPILSTLEKVYYENKEKRNNFTREQHRVEDSENPRLHILQRWNSFTPILSGDKTPSKGGGYFVTTGDVGMAFDPGFDFIQNFRNESFLFDDLDYVFVTHAHNDHVSDLESIITLLHNYNEEIKGFPSSEKDNCIYRKLMKKYPCLEKDQLDHKVDEFYDYSPRKKHLRFCISPGVKEKCGFLNINEKSDYTVTILNLEQAGFGKYPTDNPNNMGSVYIECTRTSEVLSRYIRVFPIPAKHNDLKTEKDCYGFLVIFMSIAPSSVKPSNENEAKKEDKSEPIQSPIGALWYTGDTGYDDEMSNNYDTVKKTLLKSHGITNEFVVLAHIGGFKPEEKFYYKQNIEKAYYPRHLGRIGLCRVYEELEPKLLLVSEFGEEFKNIRVKFVDELKKALTTKENVPAIIPADIGLTISFGTPKSEQKAESKEPCVILKEDGFGKSIRSGKDKGKPYDINHIEAVEDFDAKEQAVVIKYQIRQSS
jgi:ribonuclease BN (tRNA processing enzyme)